MRRERSRSSDRRAGKGRTRVLVSLGLSLSIGCGGAEERVPPDTAVRAAVADEGDIIPLGPPDTLLGEIRDVVLEGGNVWVASRGEVPLARYGLDRSPPSYPLTVGSGPDQVRQLLSLDTDRDGAVVGWDGQLGRIVAVSPSGAVTILQGGAELTDGLTVPRFDYLGGRRNQIAVLAHGLVRAYIVTARWGTTDFARATLLQQHGGVWDTVLTFRATARWIDSLLGERQRFGPFPLWRRCGRDRVAAYTPDDDAIRVYDAEWRVVTRMTAATSPHSRTDSLARGLFYRRLLWSADGQLPDAQLAAIVLGAPAEALAEAAPILPSYTEMLCADNGMVLLQRLDAEMRSGPPAGEWEVYEPGRPVRRFTLPQRFRAMDIRDTLLVGYVVDSLDVPTIAAMRLPAE